MVLGSVRIPYSCASPATYVRVLGAFIHVAYLYPTFSPHGRIAWPLVYNHPLTEIRGARKIVAERDYGLRDEEQLRVEVCNLQVILNPCRATLERLTLPAQLAPLLLATPLPSLRSISLRGWCPKVVGQDHHALWRIMTHA